MRFSSKFFLTLSTSMALSFVAHAGDGLEYKAKLAGANEVPPVSTAASGEFKIEFDAAVTKGEFQLRLANMKRVTQAHIHCGAAGVNGPVVAFLAGFHDRGWDVDGKWIGTASIDASNVITRPASPACPSGVNNLADIIKLMNEGNAYVNAHTIAFPGGEVRGQLRKD
jgi:CHRD domain